MSVIYKNLRQCLSLIRKRKSFRIVTLFKMVKGKSVPLQAWSGPGGSRKLRFPDFVTTAQHGGKVVSLTHRPPLPPGNTPGTHFCQRLSRPQGHSAIGRIFMSMKNPLAPAGIEPATFQFLAQHLNRCDTQHIFLPYIMHTFFRLYLLLNNMHQPSAYCN